MLISWVCNLQESLPRLRADQKDWESFKINCLPYKTGIGEYHIHHRHKNAGETVCRTKYTTLWKGIN